MTGNTLMMATPHTLWPHFESVKMLSLAAAVLACLCVVEGRVATDKSKGMPWPMPKSLRPMDGVYSVPGDRFSFNTSGKLQTDCDLLSSAFDRYTKIIFDEYYWDAWNSLKSRGLLGRANSQDDGQLIRLDVTVSGKCEKYPTLDSDESYSLYIAETLSILEAKTIWGALRGLETFSQLIYEDDSGMLHINQSYVKDEPRFNHRGVLLDTSRHFVHTKFLKYNLDAMAYNKLNVFHWHIVDDPAFPYTSKTFPEMSEKGAYMPYTKSHVYSQDDVKEIIEYARLRGIRVVAEFDTPGHSQSWGKSIPNLLTKCCTNGTFNGGYGPIDPSVNSTYDFLEKLFKEVTEVFPDKYVHVGGDEVDFSCWKSNPNITAFMKKMGFNDTYSKLENYYENRLLDILNKMDHDYIVWQEIIDNGVTVRPDTVVHTWKRGDGMERATKLGYRTLMSHCWYLNKISMSQDWEDFYKCDPQNFTGTAAQKALVMGGELCMWGEYADATNVISRTWPRGAAPAERLWSPKSLKVEPKTVARMEEHRCRMLRRGLQVEPVNPVGFCRYEYTGQTPEF